MTSVFRQCGIKATRTGNGCAVALTLSASVRLFETQTPQVG
ncbi:hypothetical protein ACNBFH_004435 [Salmonella enterica subsp. enterica serovar Bareilly]